MWTIAQRIRLPGLHPNTSSAVDHLLVIRGKITVDFVADIPKDCILLAKDDLTFIEFVYKERLNY